MGSGIDSWCCVSSAPYIVVVCNANPLTCEHMLMGECVDGDISARTKNTLLIVVF